MKALQKFVSVRASLYDHFSSEWWGASPSKVSESVQIIQFVYGSNPTGEDGECPISTRFG
jgi:hypothetical protein